MKLTCNDESVHRRVKFSVDQVDKKVCKRNALYPHTTCIYADGCRQITSARKLLRLSQQLYEGINIVLVFKV